MYKLRLNCGYAEICHNTRWDTVFITWKRKRRKETNTIGDVALDCTVSACSTVKLYNASKKVIISHTNSMSKTLWYTSDINSKLKKINGINKFFCIQH